MEIDLVALNATLCKGVRMIVAVRRLAKEVDLDAPELENLEMEVRERAAEAQLFIADCKSGGKSLLVKS